MENNSKEIEKRPTNLEVVIGDESVLNISNVGDCANDLRPKNKKVKSNNVIVPKNKSNE